MKTALKFQKMTHPKHNRLSLKDSQHISAKKWDSARLKAFSCCIPDTVIRWASEHCGEISLLVYEHWNPVLRDQREWPYGPIPDLSDPSAASSGCHDWGHNWIHVLFHSDACVSPETAPNKWKCCKTSKSGGINFSIFSPFSLLSSAMLQLAHRARSVSPGCS